MINYLDPQIKRGLKPVKKNYKTIDEYIQRFPVETQELLQSVRNTIRESAPEAQETIAYQLPTFRLNGNLVHFGAFKNHIGFYPTPSGAQAFKKELSRYHSGKGSIQFPMDEPMPLDLIRKMVEYRVKENTDRIEK